MQITTDSIDEKGYFDPRYTCDFDNSSPELRWSDVPSDAVGFVLVAEDPDSPKTQNFAHWVVYNIPPHVHHLPAGIPAQETLPNGIRQGVNGFGKLGYGGPCPPLGDPAHRYIFKLYALKELPPIPGRATRSQVLEAIFPFVIAKAEFMGRYQRAMQQRVG
jgi:Raf kinase inhibitor-like YbhB/YbcL family protein